jgi:hypothetical protein
MRKKLDFRENILFDINFNFYDIFYFNYFGWDFNKNYYSRLKNDEFTNFNLYDIFYFNYFG